MSTLHVLAPPLAWAGQDPGFRAWLAHGDRLPAVSEARDTALRALFRFAGDALPVAALRHHADADGAGMGAWLAADPAYIQSEATGARLLTWPVADLSGDEAAQLVASLQPLFGDAGMPLVVDTPAAWGLHVSAGAPLAEFTRPADALGVDLLGCLPRGEAGRAWRRLFTEAQIMLNAHPVNAARVADGKLPVNALWFWGAGALPGAVESALQVVASDDVALRGLAKLARVACVGPSVLALDVADTFDHAGDVLLDLDVPGQADVAGAWLAPFRRWLRERRYAAIELTFADGERFRVRHAHRLRVWRHA